MLQTQNKATLIPSVDVDAGRCRLRNCLAKKALGKVLEEKIPPINFEEFCKSWYKNIWSLQRTEKHGDDTVWFFKDFSAVRWIANLKTYALQYPSWVRLIYIPVSIEGHKEDLSYQSTKEPELYAEFLQVYGESSKIPTYMSRD